VNELLEKLKREIENEREKQIQKREKMITEKKEDMKNYINKELKKAIKLGKNKIKIIYITHLHKFSGYTLMRGKTEDYKRETDIQKEVIFRYLKENNIEFKKLIGSALIYLNGRKKGFKGFLEMIIDYLRYGI
jgi:hypothetical protein